MFSVIGIVALGYLASVSVHARLFQNREAQRFAQQLQSQVRYKKKDVPSESSTEVRQAPVEGAVIAKPSIPQLGFATVVVEGVEDGDLKLAAGHIPGTPLPGEPGNVGIAAHRDSFFFRPLRLIHKGDVIRIRIIERRGAAKILGNIIEGVAVSVGSRE